ncbi:HAMP domain-containing protein [Sediminibacillus dalangtanensis]|uniref:histidine kinase n=1 Tax=Sediminibacillus dalangtanensis TaxID=2729421 RepID=A0ABX7VTB9_9BACI|nr:ATP-binding protein [Sediminibacillus dalangtanensis]QTM99055.1 HAMP domain-containing protein [Sediminibacillus dalangtanensis]
MKRNSIIIKLGVTIITLHLLVLLPLGFTVNQILKNYFYDDVETKLSDLSSQYANMITDVQDEKILQMFNTLANMTNVEIVISDLNGRVLSSSGITHSHQDSLVSKEELITLSSNTSIKDEYVTSDEKYLKIGEPIIHDNKHIGNIILFSSISALDQSIKNVTQMLTLAGIGTVLLAIGFTFFVSRKMVSPLLQMEQVTKRISKEQDFSARVPYQGSDEIGSLANAINNMSYRLEKYQQNRHEFFSNISHELKTPITYIKGYTQAIQKKLYRDEKEKKLFLNIIENETVRMNKLMDDLMDLSKIEEGKLNLQYEKIDLTHVLEMAVNKIQIKAEEKRLTVHYNQETDIPLFVADGYRMEQIFTNLLENAVRYTEEGSIKVTISYHHSSIRIRISDTGIGISDKDIPHLFDRFYRVDKSRSRSLGGTGLGLSIVKRLVGVHGGRIHLDSVEGKGTTFTILFLLLEEENHNEKV